MKTQPKITIEPTHDLYCHYAGQTQPQPCYVYLDCDTGSLYANYSGEIGNAVPVDVWHGRRMRWAIPCLTDAAADDLLADITPLAQRIVDGYTCAWDGSNHVGRLTADAQEACESIGEITSNYPADEDTAVEVWDAADWYQDAPPDVTADTTDADLDLLANELIEEAAEYGVRLYRVTEYLRGLRDDANN